MIIDSPIVSGSYAGTGSFNQAGNVIVSGSLTVTGSIIGNLTGTASYATTSSYALTASYAANVPETSSYAISASYAINATSASYAANSNSASYSVTASYSFTATTASYAQTSSYATNIVISGSIANVDYIDFDLTASFASALGRLGYDSGEGTLQFGMAGGNVTLNIGSDLYQYVYNNTTASMSKGQVVYVSGSQGNRIAVKLASATAEQGSANTLGFVAETITAGGQGWVMTEGNLRKLNTVGLIGGKLIFLGTTPGTYTQTPPTAPDHGVRLGYAERIDATVGSIYIKIDNGYEVGELHDVRDTTTSSSYGDLFIKSGSVWINSKQLTGSYGVTGSITATSIDATSLTASNALITNNLAVNGTASFNYVQTVTGSAVIIGQEYIILNTQIPASRYAGIKVYDSGSNSTSSIVWDSLTDHWIYENASGSTYSGGGFLAGPKNTGSLGDIAYPTQYRILRSQGDDHVYDSNIIDNDTAVKIGINAEVTGSLIVTNGITGSLSGTATNATTASYILNAVSASYAASSTNADTASFVTTAQTASFVQTAQTASYVENAQSASYWSGSIINAESASYALTASYSANVPVTSSYANNAASASYALTSSYSLAGGGFPYSGSAEITGSLLISNLSGSGVRYVVTDATGLLSAQTASAVIKTTQAYTATAGQTTFAVTNGYSTGYVDVFINGSKLNATEFTDTSGTNIVLATGSFVNDIVEVVKYLPASGVSNNVLRQQTIFTASAGQTVFSASYTPGLLDIFLNGAKLAPDDYTANNGTYFTLATASAANDIIDIFVYSYQVGAFSGIGGAGAASQIAYFNTSNSITGSPNFTISGSTMTVTGSLLVSGSGTFTNIGPAVFSGSITSTEGFTGSFSGTATSASYAAIATSASYALNTTTASHAITASSADNLLVRGTLTAQTIVVQTITSSQDFVTGSTKFGSIISNTHQFTGSILLSGSIGIGTSPSTDFPLHLYAPSSTRLKIEYSTSTAGALDFYSGSTAQWSIVVDNNQTYGKIENRILSADAIRFYNSSNNVILVPSSGNVGIGTTNPTYKLDVSGNGSMINIIGASSGDIATGFRIGRGASLGAEIYDNPADNITTFNTTGGLNLRAGGSNRLTITSGGAATFAAATSATTLTTNGTAGQWSIRVNGNSTAGSSYGLGVYAGTNSSDDSFRVHSYSGTQYMTVRGDGNVGIGTASPVALLHVQAANNVVGTIFVKGGKGDVTSVDEINSKLDFGSNDTSVNNDNNIGGRISSVTEYSNGAFVGMAFSTFQQGRSPDLKEAVRITNGGNVGIGTSSPSTILHIQSNTAPNDNIGYLLVENTTSGTGGQTNSAVNVKNYNGTSQFMQWQANGIRLGSRVLTNSGTGAIYFTYGSDTVGMILKSDGTFAKTGDSSTMRILPATDNTGYVGESISRWAAIYAVNGTIQTSDGREKKDITDSDLGLNFINSLRPVSYKWIVGKNVVTYETIINEEGKEEQKEIVTPMPGVRTHYGLIAQEVKEVLGEKDFGGYVYDTDSDKMSLRYDQFIAPLIKSIQEQQTLIESLQSQINELKNK